MKYTKIQQGQDSEQKQKPKAQYFHFKKVDKILLFLALASLFIAAYLSSNKIHQRKIDKNRSDKNKNLNQLAITAFIVNRQRIKMATEKKQIIVDQKTYLDLFNELGKIGVAQEGSHQKPQDDLHVNVKDHLAKEKKKKEKEKEKKDGDVIDEQPEVNYNEVTFTTPEGTDTTVLAGITKRRAQFAKQLQVLRNQPFTKQSQLSTAEYKYYQNTRSISKYPELPLCIVVPTFNNEQNNRYKYNLNSILQQNYSNYHVVIIDDASTDQTGQLIDSYIDDLYIKYPEKKFNISVHHNKQQVQALSNLHKAAHEYCKEEEIFIIVDGDDELLGRQVFKLFNSVFQKEKSWFVYSNFISFVGTVGYSRSYKKEVREKSGYRKASFVASHLRAFYTGLFRKIKEEDLKDQNGQFFKAANDVAICIPILEMSGERITYIPEVTYLYNSDTGQNNHRIRLQEQTNNAMLIRKRQAYRRLEGDIFVTARN